jgi:hypothetical protein
MARSQPVEWSYVWFSTWVGISRVHKYEKVSNAQTYYGPKCMRRFPPTRTSILISKFTVVKSFRVQAHSLSITLKYKTSLKNLPRINTLAYFGAASVTKRKSLLPLPTDFSPNGSFFTQPSFLFYW